MANTLDVNVYQIVIKVTANLWLYATIPNHKALKVNEF